MALLFAKRLDQVETSAIRELFKLLGRPGIISFAGGFPDASMFDVEGIRAAAKASLGDLPSATAALQYGATEGYMPLREQLVQAMARKGIGLQVPDIIVTTGSQQAIDLVGKVMINPGDKVLVEGPTFLSTIQCFRLYGAEVLPVPVDQDGVQTDALEKMMEEHRPRLVYLIPSFSNPSGATLSLQRRLRVLELAVRFETLVMEDDPYSALYFDAPPPESLLTLSEKVHDSRAFVAYCGSLSKTLAPGLRIGWLIAHASLLSRATMCKQFSDAHTSTYAQATAAAYLKDGRMEANLPRMRATYARRAQAMANALNTHLGCGVAFTAPAGGLFFWVRLTGAGGKERNASVLAQRAMENGVAFVPGAPFYARDPDMSTFRLSFATADETTIDEGIARLAKALDTGV